MLQFKMDTIFRLFIGSIAWFGFGVILAEVLNNSNLFNFKLEVYLVAGSISLTFLSIKLILKIYCEKAKFSIKNEKSYTQILNVYHIFLVLIVLLGSLSLPFLWWGMIKKLAKMANAGNPNALF